MAIDFISEKPPNARSHRRYTISRRATKYVDDGWNYRVVFVKKKKNRRELYYSTSSVVWLYFTGEGDGQNLYEGYTFSQATPQK